MKEAVGTHKLLHLVVSLVKRLIDVALQSLTVPYAPDQSVQAASWLSSLATCLPEPEIAIDLWCTSRFRSELSRASCIARSLVTVFRVPMCRTQLLEGYCSERSPAQCCQLLQAISHDKRQALTGVLQAWASLQEIRQLTLRPASFPSSFRLVSVAPLLRHLNLELTELDDLHFLTGGQRAIKNHTKPSQHPFDTSLQCRPSEFELPAAVSKSSSQF